MVKDLNETLFRESIFDLAKGDNATLLVKNNTIIEFWATWCPHCQRMIPIYEEISKIFPDTDCYRMEAEKYPDVAEPFGMESSPTVTFVISFGRVARVV